MLVHLPTIEEEFQGFVSSHDISLDGRDDLTNVD